MYEDRFIFELGRRARVRVPPRRDLADRTTRKDYAPS
jgi:hypothetical protein